MQLPKLIGITGNKRHGKDTIADHLCAQYGYIKYSYADNLKIGIGRVVFCLSDEQLYGDLKEVPDSRWDNRTPREILQYVGTNLLRNQFDANIWVKSLFYTLAAKLADPNVRIVIPDIRFPNELQSLVDFAKANNHHMISIKVVRPSIICTDTHESERHIATLQTDHTLVNDNTIEQLCNSVDELLI